MEEKIKHLEMIRRSRYTPLYATSALLKIMAWVIFCVNIIITNELLRAGTFPKLIISAIGLGGVLVFLIVFSFSGLIRLMIDLAEKPKD